MTTATDTVIRARGVGKMYRIGVGERPKGGRLARGVQALTSPFAYLKRMSRPPTDDEILWAVRDVSFDVGRGEVVGIIGRNGAGKSTLLKILSRITEPTAGRVEMRGRVGSLLEVGTGFHPELTGRENVHLSGAILGMRRDEIEKKFDEIVAFSEIERFLDTPVKRYSSGMYVRLAFAVAAHLDPEIMLVDEVLAVGDVGFQKKCLGKMGEVAGQGRTVLFVSHNMHAITSMCQRAILLDGGTIVRDGPADAVVREYLGHHEAAQGHRAWSGASRPGNRFMRLRSVTLRDAEGAAVNEHAISGPLAIELAYDVIEEGAQAGFSIEVFDSDSRCVFGSISNHEPNFYGQPMTRGNYHSICRLPGDLLAPGRYSLVVTGFGANWRDSFRVEESVTFEAVDDGLLRGDYYQKYSGIVRPRLAWLTEPVAPADVDTEPVLSDADAAQA